jgi:hypothetical protein
MVKFCLALATIASFGFHARAQSCTEILAEAEVVRAKSMQALSQAGKRAGGGYRASLVMAVRSFQLQPRSKEAAERLLTLIPTDDAQQEVVMTLGESLCDDETVADMKALARIRDGLPRELATAVILAPNLLPSYLRYATDAVLDPHSTYAVEMKRVCQKAHGDFIRALSQLAEDRRHAFTTEVMDPNGCRVIALPEAER